MNLPCKVTLAMPVYNVEKYIERALLSALNQTFESIEYLVIDDKGQDESMNIVRRIVTKHPRGKYVRIIDHGENRGTGATKNTAIKEAKGKYLYFMDSDDEIIPNCIALLYDKIHNTDLDWVMGAYSEITFSTNKIINSIGENRQLRGKYCLVEHILKEHFVSIATWNKLYELDFLRKNKIKCVSNHLNEDAWFFFQLMLMTRKCILIHEITYYYYKTESSITDFRSYTEEKKQRITSQYIEIDLLKKNLLNQYTFDKSYPLLLCVTMRESFRYAYEVSCLNVSGENMNMFSKFYMRYKNNSSRIAVRQFMSYPVSIGQIFKMPRKRIEIFLYWLISFIPYFFQYVFIVIVRFIRK